MEVNKRRKFIITLDVEGDNIWGSSPKQTVTTKNLRCLICQGQSIYDSQSEFANSLKKVVEDKINENMTEKQIYKFLTDKYGEWILYEPEFNKNTYFLWLFPLAIFIFGGILIFKRKT